jgi:hypothetical protein
MKFSMTISPLDVTTLCTFQSPVTLNTAMEAAMQMFEAAAALSLNVTVVKGKQGKVVPVPN